MESTSPLLIQYELHQKLFNNVLDGFTDEESNQRPFDSKEVNHVKYLAGHMLNSQYGLALIAGLDPTIKWNDLFAVMGQSKKPETIIHILILKK